MCKFVCYGQPQNDVVVLAVEIPLPPMTKTFFVELHPEPWPLKRCCTNRMYSHLVASAMCLKRQRWVCRTEMLGQWFLRNCILALRWFTWKVCMTKITVDRIPCFSHAHGYLPYPYRTFRSHYSLGLVLFLPFFKSSTTRSIAVWE